MEGPIDISSSAATPFRDRWILIAGLVGASMLLSLVLRLALYWHFHEGPFSWRALVYTLAVGPLYDLPVKLLVLLPLALGLTLLRCGWLRFAPLRAVLLVLGLGAATFHTAVEYFFFEEFESRFNHIALDYVRHPTEVIGNIWESYNVPTVVSAALLVGGLLAWPTLRRLRGAAFAAIPWRTRLRGLLVVVATALGAVGSLALLPALDDDQNRVTGEVASNGLVQLVKAFWSADLDYSLYYATLPPAEAAERARTFLHRESTTASATNRPHEPWDVVVILEESLGSEFIGVLGHAKRKTSPGFDRWSREGLLLTSLVPTGNRTVRGLEGTLCSLVPLPGDAVLKRPHATNVATLARVFQQLDYATAFFYGGWGTFDSMKPFMPNNGFAEFIDRPQMPEGSFATIWGVADEFMFSKLLERQRQARQRGERLFATALTVSNHKPYDVPERGTAWPASRRRRESAVAYADWALADYLDRAERERLLDHTLVLVLGDHGARVYGKELIPVGSYRIPGLFLVPGKEWDGRRIDRLSSQIDLAPTLLSLMKIEMPTPFLGQDLTIRPELGGRAFVQHNRNVGLLTDTTMVVLGLKKKVEVYTRSDRHSDSFTLVPAEQVTTEQRELAKDAMAVFQTADADFGAGRFCLAPR